EDVRALANALRSLVLATVTRSEIRPWQWLAALRIAMARNLPQEGRGGTQRPSMDGCKVGKESTCGEARLIEIGRRLTSLRRTTEYNLHTPSIQEATPGWPDTDHPLLSRS